MTRILSAKQPDYLALPNLDEVSDLVITLSASAIMIILVVRLLSSYAKRQYGEMISEVIGCILVGFAIWFPDETVALLQDISQGIFG